MRVVAPEAGQGHSGAWPGQAHRGWAAADRAPPLQTFSGGYVHVLKGALSEDLLIQSFQKMGYVRRDNHRLMVTAPPPACQLLQVALGCFALRLECDILGEVLARLGTSVLPAEELLQARRGSTDVASCVARLQRRLALSPRSPPALFRAQLDLYQGLQEDEGSEAPGLYGVPSPGPGSPHSELACRPLPWEQSAKLWGSGAEAWDPLEEAVVSQASSPLYAAVEDESEPEGFSFLSLRRELLHRPGDPAAPKAPGSPGRASPQPVHGTPLEPPGYQVHSCLAPGALPALCCDTCCQLHATHCTALSACRLSHVLRALLGDTQRRLWLQRAQLDNLLYDSPGARP